MLSVGSRTGAVAALLVCCAASLRSQRLVTFPSEVASVPLVADLYGSGKRAVILAHGGRFDKESWRPQAQQLARSGFLVLALRFRGDALNADGSPDARGTNRDNARDVLSAVEYLRQTGIKTVYAVGGSLGGDAIGEAAALRPNALQRLVFLGSEGGSAPGKLSGRKLYLVTREDRSGDGLRLPGIEEHYRQARQPKQLVILPGNAHAQFLFTTTEGPRVMAQILQFLNAP